MDNCPEFEFTRFLASRALLKSDLYGVSILADGPTNTVVFCDGVHHSTQYLLSFSIEEPKPNSTLPRVKIVTAMTSEEQGNNRHKELTNHSIPIRELNVTALNDGVVYACISSNIGRIEAALAGKEVHW